MSPLSPVSNDGFVSQDDRPFRQQPSNHRRVVRGGRLGTLRASHASRDARHIEAVLDGNRNAKKQPASLDSFQCASPAPRFLCEHGDERVDGGIACFNLPQVSVHEFERRDRAFAHHRRHQAERGPIRHERIVPQMLLRHVEGSVRPRHL